MKNFTQATIKPYQLAKMHPYHHALSSVRKFGGKPEDYLHIHHWFDESKRSFADFRHRVLRHHAEGIFACEEKFGFTITNSDGKKLPTRHIGEQHVIEDLGFIPSLQDWCSCIQPQDWMLRMTKESDTSKSTLEKVEINSMKLVKKKKTIKM